MVTYAVVVDWLIFGVIDMLPSQLHCEIAVKNKKPHSDIHSNCDRDFWGIFFGNSKDSQQLLFK